MSKSSGRKTLPRSTHLSGADASLKARGAVAGGSDSIDKDSEEESIRHGSARDPAVEKLQAQDKAAFDYLARRGSEADKTGDTEEEFDHEAMANAERDLAEDAEWKRIQKNTFTRWANEHLKQANKSIDNLETDLSDGLRLISLIEVLSGKRMPRHNKKPVFRSQKLENVSIALNFLEMEGITLVNIDSTDIVDCKLKLILGLIWTLILHYAISMPMWDGPALGGGAEDKTPKQRLMGWVKDKLPDVPMHNFTKDWQDGKAIGALVDSVAPGLCPDWDDWDPTRPVDNATEAMDLADKWLNVPKLLRPEEMVDPNVDEQSMMTYLSQFPNAKVKPGAPLRKKTNVAKVRAFGPGLEPRGLVAKAPAKFTVETFGAGDGEVRVEVVGPDGQLIPCEALYNNDRKKTYSCKYFPEEEGDYVVKVYFASREIPKSPYNVCVEGFAGDASVVTASGPGIEPEGVILNKSTYFHIYAQDAGRGTPEVIVLDPKGKKDSVPVKISETDEKDVYKCEYVATTLGLHSVNVFFAGNPIPKSPFGVRVSPSSLPAKVWTSGKGLQPNGIRVNETVSFKVHTEGAGEGEVAVKILGPGGLPIRATSKKIDDFTTEYTYTPIKQGRHIVMITFANQEIPRSPFEVNISADKTTSIKAYGPGLKGGIVNRPARFTVDTNGEAGGLGFSIKGPSQAQINCSDNGDGSADVDYIPTAVGEYAVHILNDDEDIPGSPFMANILPETDFYPERVKVFGPGVENGVNPKETTYFTIDITDAGDAPLDVSILDDLGQFEPKIVEEAKGIFKCTYQPRKKQHKQTVMVNFGGVAVPGSPFRVQNDNPNDPSLVKVFGPGVEDGVQARKPTDFTVDCRKSGPGDLQVNIESKSRKKVPITMKDNKDGTQTVTYEPTEPGSQTITITLDGKEVPQSPIALKIKPGLDLNKIKLKDFETEVFVDCTNEFEVDASDLPPNHTAKVECYINGPSGEPLDCFVNKVEPNGPFNVSYVPKEEGEHDIHLKYEGQTLPDSPLPVVAMHGCDPTRVQAYGDGLEQGIVDEPNEFTIDTKNAGAGGLGLAIEGPSEAVMTCNDNKDGTATVEYVPTEEGDYDVAVRFGDDHIPGSPFKVPAVSRDGKGKGRGNPDSSKVTAYGPGLEPGNVFPGKPTEFIVDASETSDAPVKVEIRDASGKLVPKRPVIAKKPSGIHEVSYVPPPVGEPYEIAVKYNGENIPDSPFLMSSNPNLEEFIDDPEALASLGGSRKSSRDPENQDYAYSKNGTGVQRKSSRDSEGRGVADLIRNTLPSGFGKERGGSPNQEGNGEAGSNGPSRRSSKPYPRSDSKEMGKPGAYGSSTGRSGPGYDSRPGSSRHSRDHGNLDDALSDTDQSRKTPRTQDAPKRGSVSSFGQAPTDLGGRKDSHTGSIGSRKHSTDSNGRGSGQTEPSVIGSSGKPQGDKRGGARKLSNEDDDKIIGSKKDARGPTAIGDNQRRKTSRDSDLGTTDPSKSPNFRKNSRGKLVDNAGKVLPLDEYGRPIDEYGRHIDENGRPLDSRKPQFKQDKKGNPVDESDRPYAVDEFGRPVDNQGRLIDEFGRPIDEYGRPQGNNDASYDTYGRPAGGRVPNFREGSDGNPVDEYGHPLDLDNIGRPIDNQGRVIDEYGRPIDAREPKFVRNSTGQPVDEQGHALPVDKHGRPVDDSGRLVDEFGRPIDAYGRPIDEYGHPKDQESNNNPMIDSSAPLRKAEDRVPQFRQDSRGNLLDADGHKLPVDKYGRPIDDQGRLVDEFGHPMDAREPQFRRNSRGQPVDEHGSQLPLDKNGRPIDGAGRLVDEFGRPIDKYGRPIDIRGKPLPHSSSPGSVNQYPEARQPQFRHDSRGNLLDADGQKLPTDKYGRPIDDQGRLVDEFGRPIDAREPLFRRNSRGHPLDEQGRPLSVDKDGRPIDGSGRLVDELGRPIDVYGRPVDNHGNALPLANSGQHPEARMPQFRQDSRGNLLDADGRKLPVDKYGRPIDDQGRLVDEFGRPVDAREPQFRRNSRGQPVNEQGRPFVLDKDGRPVNGSGSLVDELGRRTDEYGRPIDNLGNPLPHSINPGYEHQFPEARRPQFRQDSRGNLLDAGGQKLPLDKFGRPIDDQGRLVDDLGCPIDAREPQFRKNSRGQPVDEQGRQLPVDKNGRPIDQAGRLVDELGRPIDEYGRPIDNHGNPVPFLNSPGNANQYPEPRKPLFRQDSKDNLLDSDGQKLPLDKYGRPTDNQGRLVDEFGRPIDAREPQFRRNSRGQPLDEQGQKLPVDKLGRPVNGSGGLVDEFGRPIDEYGRPIDNFGNPLPFSNSPRNANQYPEPRKPHFRQDSKDNLLDSDGQKLPLDKYGRPIDDQGRLVDEFGRPIDAREPQFRRNSRGQPLDEQGQKLPVDKLGRPVNGSGGLVDEFGRPIDEYGRPIDNLGNPVPLSSSTEKDHPKARQPHFKQDSRGNLLGADGHKLPVDKYGRPIDDQGRLVDELGRPIDAREPQFRKNSRGQPVDEHGSQLPLEKNGRPIDGTGRLVDEFGRPIDKYGRPIDNIGNPLLHSSSPGNADQIPDVRQPKFRQDSRGNPVDADGQKLALDKFGRPIDDQGRLVDELGRPIDAREPQFRKNSRGLPVDEQGRPLQVDKDGRPVDGSGRLIDEFERPIDGYGRPIDNLGNPLPHSSRPGNADQIPEARQPQFRQDSRGNLLDADGQKLPLDKYGRPIDDQGRLVDEFGRPIDAREPQFQTNSRGQPLDEHGQKLPVDTLGRPVNGSGELVDEFSRPIDEYGRPIDNYGIPISHAICPGNPDQIPEARKPQFRKDSRGNLLDADGHKPPLDTFGRPIDDQGRLVDELGRPIDAREPQFRKNSRGQPVDEQGRQLPLDKIGRPINGTGRLVDEFGRPIDEYGRPIDNRGNPIPHSSNSSNPNQIPEARQPKFRKDSRGNIMGADGQKLPTDKYGRPVDDQGRLVDELGRPIDAREPQFRKNSRGLPVDEQGRPLQVDKDGRPVDFSGRLVDEFGRPIDNYGRPIDNDGNLMPHLNSLGDGKQIPEARRPQFKQDSRGNLLDADGQNLPTDKFGRPIDDQGRLVDEFGRPIDAREPQFRRNSRGQPVDDQGRSLPVDGKGRPIDQAGRPVDEFGRPIDEYGRAIDNRGNPIPHSSNSSNSNQIPEARQPKFRQDSRGNLIGADGQALPLDKYGRPIDDQGRLIDELGRPIDAREPQFRKNSRGQPVDEQGLPLALDKQSRPLDEAGGLVDEFGRPIDEYGRPIDNTGNPLRRQQDPQFNPLSQDAQPSPSFRRDSSGNPLDHNGKRMPTDDCGRPVDQSGRLIDEYGSPINVEEPTYRKNSHGVPLDPSGTMLNTDKHGRPINNLGQLVDGQNRLIDDYGKPVDCNGLPLSTQSPHFGRNSNGAPLNSLGEILPMDKFGRPIDDSNQLVDETGYPVIPHEPSFRTNSQGLPVDGDGRALPLDQFGRPINDRGNLVDEYGHPIDEYGQLLDPDLIPESRKPSFKEASSGNPVDEFGRPLQCDKFGRPIDDQGRHIDEFGRPINSRAPNFKKNSQGSPLDENGQPQPLDKFGRPVDTTGQLVDEFGRPIDEYGRPLDSRRTSMSGDGRPIQGRVPNFKKNSRGNLLSKSGNPLPLDGFGRPIDEHGRPIDEFGAPIDSREPVFKKDSIGKPVNDYGLHLPVDALGRPVDANDRLIDEFGRLIDEYGRPIDHSGCLLDHSGRPLDASGKPFGGKHGGPGGRRSSSARALLPEGSSSGDSLSGPDSLGSAPGSGRFGDRKPLGSSHPYDSSGFSSRKTSVLDDSTHPYGKPSNPGSRKSSDISQTQGSSFYSSSRKSSDIDHPYESMSKPGVRKGSDMGGAHNRPQAGLRNIDHPRSNTHDPSLISVADPRRISPSDNSHDNNGNSRGNYGSRPGSSQDQILAKGPHDSQTIPGRDAFSPDTLDRKGHSPYGSRSGSRNDLLPGFNQPNTIPPGGESLNNPSGSPPGGSRQSSRSNMYGNGGLPGRPSNSGQDYSPLELSNIPLPSARGDVETVVRTPSGNIAYPYVEDNGNGSIGVSYQPTERGPHSLDVKHDGEHIQGSPYKFYSSPMEDGQVHAFGPGLAHAVCGDPADFVISTKGAGAGGLALAVEGPSKAEINCNDNKDGTVNVSYLPTAPGEYKISAKFADKHIEGSPFTCKVTGEGKKRNAISVGSSSELSLPDNLSDYDLRALDAYIISPSGNEEPCFLKKLPQGNTGISFTPKETGEHLVSVKRNEKHIKNSPFKIVVKPDDVGDASRVKVTGKALSEGKTQEDNTFHIDTKKAGYGGLSLSVEGPSKAEIKCNDHEDGSLDVSYCPTQPGLYIINLKFADQHVPGSPFAAAVSGLGQESKHERINHLREAVPVTEVGSQCRLTFKMPGINARDLETDVRSPSGKINKAAITEIEDGLYAVNFVPYELGIHTVSVQYHDLDIPGSPFQFTVGPLQDGGAHRVHAGGSGLERGVQGQPTDFNVWTREAGHGSLAISVEGPSKAVVDFKDRKDGSCHVSYTVEEPGEYTVGIRFNDQHIPGSPYKAYIQPASDEADRIRLSNIADHPVKPDTPQTMLLNMNGADGDVECRIVAPSGREDDCFITPLGSGEHTVRFVPKEEGVHYLHARFNGVHIPGSPFKIIVGNLNNNDPSTVSVAGRGIESGITGEKSMFVIDTSSVGAGTLSITVDGPSKVDLACHEVDHGYEVSYTPMVPGKYYVTVKYNGKNIAGSPFSVHISGEHLGDALSRQRKSSRSSMTMETLKRTSYIRHQYTESRTASSQSFSRSSTVPLQHQTSSSRLLGAPLPADASKVRCAGSGLMNAKTLRHNSFQVDGSQAGDNVLFVGIWGPDVPCEEVVIKHQGNKKYSVDYYVKDKGKYIVYVKWGDDHIPGSPFHIEAR